jgi:hypothetical protein
MPRVTLVIAILAATAALGACGGDDDSTTETSASAPVDCVESFTSSAPDTLVSLAGLSHDPQGQVTVGSYSGEEFEAETYDTGTSGDGAVVTVAPGACVVTEVSRDFGPLYLFVEADDGAWHRLLESDPKVPLVPDPESQLEEIEQVEIEEIGA